MPLNSVNTNTGALIALQSLNKTNADLAVTQNRVNTGLRVASVVPGGPADRAGLRVGDLLLTAGGREVATAQDLQRLMFAEAIGHPLQVTVMRNGALVDVIAEPTELVAA